MMEQDPNRFHRPSSAPPILQNATSQPYGHDQWNADSASGRHYLTPYEYYQRAQMPSVEWKERWANERNVQQTLLTDQNWQYPVQTPFGAMPLGNGVMRSINEHNSGYIAIQQDFPRTESPPVDGRKFGINGASPISPPVVDRFTASAPPNNNANNNNNNNNEQVNNGSAKVLTALPIHRSLSKDSDTNSVNAPFYGLPPLSVQRTFSNGSNPPLTPLGLSRSHSNASNSSFSGVFNGMFVPRDVVPSSPLPLSYNSPMRGPPSYNDPIAMDMMKRESYTGYHARAPMNNINAVCGEGVMYTAPSRYDVVPMSRGAQTPYLQYRPESEYRPSSHIISTSDIHDVPWVEATMGNPVSRQTRKQRNDEIHGTHNNNNSPYPPQNQATMNGNESLNNSPNLILTNAVSTTNTTNSNSNHNNRTNRTRRRNNRTENDENVDVDVRQYMRNNASLQDLVKKKLIVRFACDQNGSRFIQTCLESANYEDKEDVFDQIFPDTLRLCTDVFGNYVVQKFFEYGDEPHKIRLASRLMGRVLPLSLSMYGCRVVQKALECVNDHLRITLIEELRGNVEKCVRDQNGNHVIQKCIEEVPDKHLDFITETFVGKVYEFSTHPYGCRVIQRLLEHCTNNPNGQTRNPHHNAILEEIRDHVLSLAKDQYGNYVVQHVLSHGPKSARVHIVNTVEGHILSLSKHKFASNVVEKSFMYARDEAQRDRLLDEVMGTVENSPLVSMVRDQYANYVVQKILEVINENQRHRLVKMITAVVPHLRKFIYGKHIINKIEQLTGKNVG